MISALRKRLGRTSFETKLAAWFSALAILVVTIVSVVLTRGSNAHLADKLEQKGAGYAHLLSRELQPVVAFDDQLTARDVFDSLSTDVEVVGLAVYGQGGKLIAGRGQFPNTALATGPADQLAEHRAPVVSPEGPSGIAYVRLSTQRLVEQRRAAIIASVQVGALTFLIALALAWILARTVTRRIGRIGTAASRVAAGDLAHPPIDPGPADEIGQLATAFNHMVADLHRMFEENKHAAATEQVRLERLVAAKTQELRASREQYRLIAESIHAMPFTYVGGVDAFSYVGPQAERMFGYGKERWIEPGFLDQLVQPEARAKLRAKLANGEPHLEEEVAVRSVNGDTMHVRIVAARGEINGAACHRGLILDTTARKRLETELAQAQKLESVGRLAAGVAHEINTPIQFVGDSIHFVRDAMRDLLDLVAADEVVRAAVLAEQSALVAATAADDAAVTADLPYLREHLPKAFERMADGLSRVSTIVASMKEFAHPDHAEKMVADLNQAIRSTLTIARNEYKYVADLEIDLADLPPIKCHLGDINQTVLNIVVNAAHAISDIAARTGQRGKIVVRTRRDGDHVEISIADTGGGIPAGIRDRIYDPFFTTKEVGKGTGQGLAIARSVVIDKHAGTLRFVCDDGIGTTFYIRIPIGTDVIEQNVAA